MHREETSMLTTENSLLLIVDVQGKLAQIMDNREALLLICNAW